MEIKRKRCFDILFCCVLVLLGIIMFRNCYDYGMEFDEVYRINNLFKYFNENAAYYEQSICSIQIGSIVIPLMLKQYISYTYLLLYIPVAISSHPFIALRSLYCVYMVIPALATFWVFKKKNYAFAVMTSVLLIVCPLLYPYIRYGWASILYMIPIVLFYLCIQRYQKEKHSVWIFCAAFVLAFYVNILFYFIWNVVAIIVALVVIYPKRSFRFVLNLKNDMLILAGCMLGMINYIIYNVKAGFPTIRTLYNYLFKMEDYNKTAIDGVATSSLVDSFSKKWDSYVVCAGDFKLLFGLMLIIVIAVHLITFIVMLKKQKISEYKECFIPFICLLVTFGLIMISPNSEASHHLTYIVGPLCMTISVAVIFISLFAQKRKQTVWVICAMIVVGFNTYASNYDIKQAVIENGTGKFSNQIFSLINDVASDENIQSNNLMIVEWGLSSQFYFMSRGELSPRDLTFTLISTDYDLCYELLKTYVKENECNLLYVPIYFRNINEVKGDENFEEGYVSVSDSSDVQYSFMVSDQVRALITLVNDCGGVCVLEHVYQEETENSGILLLKIDNFTVDE